MDGVHVIEVEDDQSKMIGNKRGRGNDEVITPRLEKRPSGMMMINQMFDQEEKEKYNNNNFDYSGNEMINGVKYEEEKDTTPTPSPGGGAAANGSGGLFNQFINNLVSNNNYSPKSNLETRYDEESKTKDDVGGGGEGEGGRVINNIISNIFTSSNDNGKEEVVVEEKDTVQVVDDVGDEKDGVIDNIVAQLPRTLSEDTAPATDEASILIHSIIHD